MKRIVSVVLGFTLMAIAAWAIPGNQSAEESNQARVARNKRTILQRMGRKEVTFRGGKPGEMRVRWEWYDSVISRYRFEKRVLMNEKSAQEKYALRSRWVFMDMRVTLQELFALGSEHDDKLMPIIASQWLVSAAPSATFEGLTLRGKKGEVKGLSNGNLRQGDTTRRGWKGLQDIEHISIGSNTRTRKGICGSPGTSIAGMRSRFVGGTLNSV